MASFLISKRERDGDLRHYVGGCRVTKGSFHALGTGDKSCFHNYFTGSHWHFRFEQAL